MTKNPKVTLQEVAALAGVSAITVSRALREPEKVSKTSRNRIEKAVRELGYVPNPAARALAAGRTDVIGVIIPSVSNSVFADVLRGIYEAVEGTRFDVQLGNTRYSPSLEEDLLRVFLSQKPAGLVVAGIDQSPEARALLERASCPIVQVMEIGPDPVDRMIGFSHYDAARAATRHLLDKGYVKPAFVGARMDPRTQRRFHGFRDEASEAGVFDERRVVTTTEPSAVSVGSRLFSDLLSRTADFDAVFCINDDVALGVLFEAQRRRVDIPQELGICGFNDLDMVSVAEPPLTSVKTHRFEMGQMAVEALIGLDPGRFSGGRRVVDLGFEIIARASTARV